MCELKGGKVRRMEHLWTRQSAPKETFPSLWESSKIIPWTWNWYCTSHWIWGWHDHSLFNLQKCEKEISTAYKPPSVFYFCHSKPNALIQHYLPICFLKVCITASTEDRVSRTEFAKTGISLLRCSSHLNRCPNFLIHLCFEPDITVLHIVCRVIFFFSWTLLCPFCCPG